MDYQVCTSEGLALSVSNICADFLTARHLQQHPSVNHKPFILTICPLIVIGKQDRADLALLDHMHHVADAGYLSGDQQGCMKGTRRDVLVQIEQWSRDKQDKRVFWFNGLAGTGKSTIAQTFAEMCFADGKLGASFFCLHDFEDRSNLQSILPTLAFQLTHCFPQFRWELLPVLMENPDVGQETLCSQMEKLIVGPFQATKTHTLIVIDGLDECQDKEPASALLSILSRYVDKIPFVKFFITGRPEPRIRSGFRLESLRPHTDMLKLHEVQPSLVDSDIKLFLKTWFTEISKNRSDCNFEEDWPGTYHIDVLSRKAAGLFIYASTVIKFVSSPLHLPNERLHLIYSLRQDTSHEGRSGIDLLYTQVLEQAFHDVDSHDHELHSRFRSVVGTIVLIFHPLSINILSDLLSNDCTPPRISTSLRTLHSVLLVPDSTDDPVRVFHKSFPDFLTDPGRCTDHRFFIDPLVHHKEILVACFDVMKKRLKRNICKLDAYVVLSKIEDLPTLRATHICETLKYACQYWTHHLAKIPCSSDGGEDIQSAIKDFFTTGFLFWVEVLSLTGNLEIGLHALYNIEQWYKMVSQMQKFYSSLCSCLSRQEFPASGQLIASNLSWIILTQSRTALQGYTMMPPYFVPLHPGSMCTIPQSSHTGLRWWLGQLNGEHAFIQFLALDMNLPLHTGTTTLQQLVLIVKIS